jgi:hypothetical protein
VAVTNRRTYYSDPSSAGEALYVDGKLMQINGAVHGMTYSNALNAGINSYGNAITLSAGPHLVYVEKFSSTADRNREFCAWGYWAGPDTVATHPGWGPGTFPEVIFGSTWPAFHPVDFAPGGCIKLDGTWTDPSGATVTISGGGGRWDNGRPGFTIAPRPEDCNIFSFAFPDAQVPRARMKLPFHPPLASALCVGVRARGRCRRADRAGVKVTFSCDLWGAYTPPAWGVGYELDWRAGWTGMPAL